MYKRIFIEPYSQEENRANVELVDFKVKTASNRPNYVTELMSKVTPQEGFTYMLGNIVGSDEIWGDNNKHDTFPREQLNPSDPNSDYGYKTFMRYGAPYIEHANNSEHLKVGSVENAIWVPDTERVYVLLKLANHLIDPDYLDALKRYEVGLSMGCKIEKDVCSYCGHEARNDSERCEHIPSKLGSVMPNGVKVKMINIHPKFFDATLTLFPADRTAQMLKAASMVNKASMIKEDTNSKNHITISPLKSKILNQIEDFKKATDGIRKRDIDIPTDVIRSVEPEVFLAIMLSNNSLPKVKELRKMSSIPSTLTVESIIDTLAKKYNNCIPEKLAGYLPFRSSDRDSLVLRLLTVKPEYTDDTPTEKEAGLLSSLLWLIPGYYILKHLILLANNNTRMHIPSNIQLSPSTMSALTNPNFANQVAMSRLGIAPPLPNFSFTQPNTIDGLPLSYLLSKPTVSPLSKLGSSILERFEVENLFSSDKIEKFDMQLASLFSK
jgi:hypothetical protein